LEKSFFTSALGRFAIAGVILVGVLVWGWPIEQSADAAARASKVTICHRTRSTTNPYRRITVSKNAAKGGHTTHSKTGSTVNPPWTSTLVNSNGGVWGDIIPSGTPSVSAINYNDRGTTAEQRGYAIWNQTSPYTSTCRGMSTKEFVRIHVESGGDLEGAMDELDDMDASEDDALLQSLGSGFRSWYDALPASQKNLTSLEAQIDAESPAVITGDAIVNSTTSATLQGTAYPRGLALTAWFEWGTSSSNLSNTTADITIASGNNSTQSLSHTVSSGLTSGSLYYYRAVILSTSGTPGTDSAVDTIIYGDVVPFRMGTADQLIDFPTVSSQTYGTTFTVSATSKDATSPNPETGLTVSFSSLDESICTVGSSSIASNVSSATVTPVTVGTCKIKATQSGGSALSKSFKAAPAVTQEIVIGAKTLTVSGVSASNKEYDGTQTATVSCSSPALTGVVSGDVGLVSVSCTSPSGTFNVDGNVGSSKSVTVSGVTLAGGRANRYSLTISLTANITTKALTVTADNKTLPLNTAGTFTVTGTGLVGSDQLNSAGTTYTFSGGGLPSATTTQPQTAGTYTITPSAVAFTSGSPTNYTINYATGTLTVSSLSTLSVQTIDFPSISGKTYGDADFTIDATSKDGGSATGLLVDLVSLTPGICSVGTSALAGSISRATVTILAAGSCQIRASQSGGGSYGSAENVTRSFTISPKAVAVTADNKSKVEDDLDPTFTVSQTGLVSPHTVNGVTYTFAGTGSTSYAASTTVPTAAGTYSITPSAATLGGGGNTANYTFSYNAGTYTITAASSGGSGGSGGGGQSPGAATTTTTTIAAATTSTTSTVLSRRITICHRTMAGAFVEITVDRNSLGGHANHETDIIPAPPGGCGRRAINQFLATTTTTTIPEIDGGRTNQASPRRITICHWNASNSYVQITVDANGLNGHGDHPNDIIPAPAGGCGSASVQRVLSSTTTTTLAPGSLEDTKQKLDEERKGGKDKSILDVVNLEAEPKPGGGGGGTIEIEPKKSGPAVQLLDAKTSDPDVKVVVKSSGSDYNKTDTWVNEGFGSYCWKIESFNGEYSYILPSPPNPPDSRYAGLAYSAVKVKAGSVVESDPNYQANTVFMNPAPGSMVWPDVNKNGILDPGGQGGGTLGDKAISHIILCVGETQFSGITTTPTTVPSGTTTTTTTVVASTTTVAGTTTSAPLRSTTTTSARPRLTTTTTIRASATTVRPVATTVAPSVQQSTTTVRSSVTTVRPTTTTVRPTTTTVRPVATTVAPSVQQSTTTVRSSVTTVRPTTTTVRPTTTTVRPVATTVAPSVQQSTTTVRSSVTTVRPTTTTVRPTTTTVRPTTTTIGSSATTQPGYPSTTLPEGTTPPIVIELEVPEENFNKQSVVVELLVSTGSQSEVVFLSVDMKNFSVDVPQQVVVLPATGVQATGSSGVFAQALAGLGALLAGALLLFGRSRRRSL